jgi:hypothetical protein
MLAWVVQKTRALFRAIRERWQAFLVSLIFAVLALVTLYSAFYALPPKYQRFSYGETLTVILGSPVNLSPGNEGEILVTVVNTSAKTLSEVIVQLVYPDAVPLAAGLKEGNSLKFEELMAGERRSGRIKVKPLFRFRTGWPLWEPPKSQLDFNVRVGINKQTPEDIGNYSLTLAPLPKIRWLLNTVGAFTLSLVVGLLRAWWKGAFGIPA